MRPRRVLPIALEWMHDDPVLLLEGPRSVGKSTLLREIASATDGVLIDLDDPGVKDAVTADPALFVQGDRLVCIDEYQKAPVVLDAIKAELNRRTTPGRFVLAGSARHDTLPSAAQALTGRLSRLHVYPLSQGELAGVHENFLSTVFESPTAVVAAIPSVTSRSDYIDRIVRGGFPLAVGASTAVARRSDGRAGQGNHAQLHLTDREGVPAAPAPGLGQDTYRSLGHLLETFAVGELLKQASWCADVAGTGHWRTHDQLEVDLVIELDDGGVVGFEVKSGSRVPGEELKPLKKLRDAVGPNFRAGYALYLGERSYTFEDRIHVVPLDRLWTPTA